MMSMKYDPIADAAYLKLVQRIGEGEAFNQVVVEDSELKGMVVLDLDESGFLLGVEIIGASDMLRPETLGDARRHE